MTFERYAGWLGRGRTHQAHGRAIDALLCYRRALREVPSGIDARFHLGEIAWSLGNHAEAIAAWQRASELSPKHVPSLHALADAFAATGQIDAALQAARRVLALQPDEPRATALGRLAAMASGKEVIDDDVLTATLQSSANAPLALLAAVALRALERADAYPRAVAVALDAAAAAPITRANEDLLRALAAAAANAGLRDRAQPFADHYADACHALSLPAMPMLWARRTAGAHVRAGVICMQRQVDDIARLPSAIDARAVDAVRWTAFVAPEKASDAVSSIAIPGCDARPLPADAEVAARGIASLDLDVLVDTAGLYLPTGPLLARRPARETWSLQFDDRPVARPLFDRVFVGDRALDAFGDAMIEVSRAIQKQPLAEMSAAELSAVWEEAVQAHRRGDDARAAIGYARVLKAQPEFAPALYLAGLLARVVGDSATALSRLRAAVQAAPSFADAREALIDAEIASDNAVGAMAIAHEGLERSSGDARLWRALGRAALKTADAQAAVAAFSEALKREPTHGETHYNHGVALQMVRDAAEAARAYQRALAFEPELHAADFNLGVIFEQQGNAGAAMTAFSHVLDRAPAHAAAYRALAETLLASGRIEAWFANFERFEAHCPQHLSLAALGLEVCAYRADFDKLDTYLDGLRNGRFSEGEPTEVLDALQQILYLLHFFDVEPQLIGRHARTHDALARRLYGEPWQRRTPRMPGRIRVGYLSGDFRNHVMGKMMWEALRHHDRERFDIVGYATTAAHDAWTDRYVSLFPLHVVDGMSDAAAAARIAEDDLDVLVDLSTHTKGARPGILAAKPARVQITHVATAGTLAMSAIDFKLTDRYADIAHDVDAQIELPLIMEGCVYPYRHVDPASSGVFTRERAGIRDDAIVIGAFVTPMKLSQRCLALWRDVLQRVPNAILAFSPVQPALRTVFQRICAAGGIDHSRIAFIPQGRDDAESQARYRLIDFVLDPLPYGGVNGTLEALDMQVPVVTLVGRRHGERTSYSILANLGIRDTIAETGNDYVQIAEHLATDREFMQSLRQRIAAALRNSALTDMVAHTRHLEHAYLTALAQRAPEALHDARHDVRSLG